MKLRSPHSPHLQIEFSTNSPTGHTHGGFLLTYSPFGEIPAPVTKPPEETTFAPEGVSSFSTLLTVRERDQNNETWALFRELLCQATNNFTMNHNMTLETCHPENVTFTSITKCSSLWPNNLECIELSFHILLAEGNVEDVTEDPLNGFEFSFPQELSAENLEAMWREFGEDIFKANKFPRYIQPQANGLILFWSGMVVAAIIVFILFLILISRLQVLKSVVKWPAVDEDNQNILKKSQDIDITMFPSPHQIVPTLFPSSTSAYSPGSSFLYGGDVYDNRPRDALECFNETDPSLLPGLRRNSSFGLLISNFECILLNQTFFFCAQVSTLLLLSPWIVMMIGKFFFFSYKIKSRLRKAYFIYLKNISVSWTRKLIPFFQTAHMSKAWYKKAKSFPIQQK